MNLKKYSLALCVYVCGGVCVTVHACTCVYEHAREAWKLNNASIFLSIIKALRK